ncbi:hypothetical protein P152DRAFT_455482 [Eremomyces bilateralis CBS 781.70]|uniref:gamma-glutamylcyclotransferase n=1 Tax=Eremomyces bilateralis CBS 781.70 TaxID=1392243 RepID=A0A6G1GCY4_9PEZI|nr:uncharacterized protein P152DRAFT_455482 [Eremomyces bilateralis CBS 781.70]KAF1815766.1 hypothetical protein P152DRAFT_455482 [Eremomyces bilateralis CBS 781.70]
MSNSRGIVVSQPSQTPIEETESQIGTFSIIQWIHTLLHRSNPSPPSFTPLSTTTPDRLSHSQAEQPIDLDSYDPSAQKDTVLYLAYGSNLCDAKFQGDRAIRPLSAVNVHVPSLKLAFDLPGLPYMEPCFANSNLRDPESDEKHPSEDKTDSDNSDENDGAGSALLPKDPPPNHRNTPWTKGLVGVVYEVTPSDYAHIIATEGGGGSYHDIVVPCFPIDANLPSLPTPTAPSFNAHTLYSPPLDPGAVGIPRPDPGYAQASARYLKMLADGGRERGLPGDYRRWLEGLEAYTVTTRRQRVGSVVVGVVWLPMIVLLFVLTRVCQGADGRSPGWLVGAQKAVFQAVWVSYDTIFKSVFGDGERTVHDGEKDW